MEPFDRYGFGEMGKHLARLVLHAKDEGHRSDMEATNAWARELGLGPSSAAIPYPKLYAQLEKQLSKDGIGSIFDTMESYSKIITEHEQKLADLQAQGKFTSSVISRLDSQRNSLATIIRFLQDKGFYP